MEEIPGVHPMLSCDEVCDVTDGEVQRFIELGQAILLLPGPQPHGAGIAAGRKQSVAAS